MKVKFPFYKSVLLALCLALIIFSVALAASGGLDKTFSGDGRIMQDFGGISHLGMAVAVQSDGKVVVVGEKWLRTGGSDFAIARYQTNGALDTTFSGDGKQWVSVGPLNSDPAISRPIDKALSVVIQADGKIVVGGQTCTLDFKVCDVALARLNVNGTLDSNFGVDGKVITNFGADSADNGGYALALQGNKIVVAGYLRDGNSYGGAVYQYNANGSLDATFSGDGIMLVDFGQNDFLNAVIVNAGKIYVAGASRPYDAIAADFILARINIDGTLDTNFGVNGKVQTDLGVTDVASSLVISNKKIFLAGYSDNSLAIAKYATSGALDTTFDGDGIITLDGGLASPGIASVAIQGGKILIAGYTDRTSSSTGDAFLMRYTAAGKLDPTFSQDGLVLANWGGADRYNAVVFKNSRIYVVGTSKTTAGVNRFIIARYLP